MNQSEKQMQQRLANLSVKKSSHFSAIATSVISIRNLWNFVKDSTALSEPGGSGAVDPGSAVLSMDKYSIISG